MSLTGGDVRANFVPSWRHFEDDIRVSVTLLRVAYTADFLQKCLRREQILITNKIMYIFLYFLNRWLFQITTCNSQLDSAVRI